MMRREAEPELMSRREQVIAYSEADFSKGEENFIHFIVNYLKDNQINLSNDDLIIDLGCGPGNITERLSFQWPDVDIIGIDGSTEMINKAESRKFNAMKEKKFQNINYICADIKKINLKDITSKKNVSLLVSNSLIHHITKIEEFFECIIKFSNKKTINFHKDLMRPINKSFALKLRDQSAGIYGEILTNDYYASLKASYRSIELINFINEWRFKALNVIEDENKYLIVYGKV